jgi:hypothetical protein
VLAAGLLLALVDAARTGGGASTHAARPVVDRAAVALASGRAGAGNATWGTGWIRSLFRRLRDDGELDRRVAGTDRRGVAGVDARDQQARDGSSPAHRKRRA